jgi:hypothetical protein
MPLMIRQFETQHEFMDIVLPVRHRVLWPKGPLSEALVKGDDDIYLSSHKNLNDEKESITSKPIHLGLYEGFKNSIVGVISLYVSNTMATNRNCEANGDGDKSQLSSLLFQVQMRKFAVEEWCQGRGFGSILLQQAKEKALERCHKLLEVHHQQQPQPQDQDENQKCQSYKFVLWCDARAHQASFYLKRGFIQTGDIFMKYDKDYVRMEHVLWNYHGIHHSSPPPPPPSSCDASSIPIPHVELLSSLLLTSSLESWMRIPYKSSQLELRSCLELQQQRPLLHEKGEGKKEEDIDKEEKAACESECDESSQGVMRTAKQDIPKFETIGTTDVLCMNIDSVKSWLLTINKVIGRGSEFRKAKELIR